MDTSLIDAARALCLRAAVRAAFIKRQQASSTPVATTKAPLLSLPIELLHYVTEFLDQRDQHSLRACCVQTAKYLHDDFYGRSTFHVNIEERHLQAFQNLAESASAAKVKKIKFGDRVLLLDYTLSIIKYLGGPATVTRGTAVHTDSTPCLTSLRKEITPSDAVLRQYLELLPKYYGGNMCHDMQTILRLTLVI